MTNDSASRDDIRRAVYLINSRDTDALDLYTAANLLARVAPALLDRIARLEADNARLRGEREALMTGLGLDPETPDAHTLSEVRAAGAGALMRIEYLETELDRLRGAAQTFCEERSDAALDRLIAALEEARDAR